MTTQRRPPSFIAEKAARAAAASLGAPARPAHGPDDLCRLVAAETVTRRAGARPRGGPASRLRRYEYLLPVFESFSIEDVTALTLDIVWGEREQAQLFSAAESHCLVWAPVEARASLVVELRDTPPGVEGLDEWDHVAEFGLALPSGRLRVLTDVVGDPPVLRVHPGPHRVRLCIGNLASVPVEDGRPVGGFVRYRVALWPRDFSSSVVLKQREGELYP